MSASMQEQVAAWMKAFGQDVPEKPCVPSAEVIDLRQRLIMEEATEAVNALECCLECCHYPLPDLTDVADGLADSLVVIFGTFAALGIDSGPIFQDVMESNWSKMWTNAEAQNVPLEYSAEEIGTGERRWLIKRKDGKVIKSPSYLPPNLLPIIESQMKGKV